VPTSLEKVDRTLCFGKVSRNRKHSNFIRQNLDKNSFIEENSIMPSNRNSASSQNQRVISMSITLRNIKMLSGI